MLPSFKGLHAQKQAFDYGAKISGCTVYFIENDWLEAIIALPTELFYNTGIATYIWIVTNNKPLKRKDKIQLINAIQFYHNMKKSLGNKRKFISGDQIKDITEIYTGFKESKNCKIFDNDDFGYTKVTIEQPLEKSPSKNPKPDPSKRDYERITLKEDIDEYFTREVNPHLPDAWMDRSKDKIGYEINFTKYFYEYKPLRPLEKINKDLLKLEEETEGLLKEILK